MKVTNKEALQLYHVAIDGDFTLQSKESKFKAAAVKFITSYKLEETEIDKFRRKFSRLLESKPKNPGSPAIVKWENSVFHKVNAAGR